MLRWLSRSTLSSKSSIGVRVGVRAVGVRVSLSSLNLGKLALKLVNFNLEVSLEEVWGGGVHVGGPGLVIQWLLSSLLVIWACCKLFFTSLGSVLNRLHLVLHSFHLSVLLDNGSNFVGLILSCEFLLSCLGSLNDWVLCNILNSFLSGLNLSLFLFFLLLDLGKVRLECRSVWLLGLWVLESSLLGWVWLVFFSVNNLGNFVSDLLELVGLSCLLLLNLGELLLKVLNLSLNFIINGGGGLDNSSIEFTLGLCLELGTSYAICSSLAKSRLKQIKR